jgi:hypothetical protein
MYGVLRSLQYQVAKVVFILEEVNCFFLQVWSDRTIIFEAIRKIAVTNCHWSTLMLKVFQTVICHLPFMLLYKPFAISSVMKTAGSTITSVISFFLASAVPIRLQWMWTFVKMSSLIWQEFHFTVVAAESWLDWEGRVGLNMWYVWRKTVYIE